MADSSLPSTERPRPAARLLTAAGGRNVTGDMIRAAVDSGAPVPAVNPKTNEEHVNKVADTQLPANPEEAAPARLEPPPETTGIRPETYLELSPESPSFPRRKCPHGGVGRPKRQHALDACLGPTAEPEGHPGQGGVPGAGGLAAEVIEQLAQLIVRTHACDGNTD